MALSGKLIGIGGGTSDHSKLTNRDAANQHPISAIEGLQGALDARAKRAEVPAVDGTLSKTGQAADAAATGEAVAAVHLTATEDTPGTVTLALGGDIRPAAPKVYCDNDFNTNADGITFATKLSAGSSVQYSERKVNASGNGYLYLNSHSNNNPVAYWNKGENGKAIQELPDKFVMSFDIALPASGTTRPFSVSPVDENGKAFNVMDITKKLLRVLFKNDDGTTDSKSVVLSASASESNPKYNSITITFDMGAKTFTISGTDSTGTPYEFADCKMRIPDGFGTVQYIAFKARNDDTATATNTGAFLLDNLKIYGDAPVEEKKPLKAIRFPGLDGTFAIPQPDSIEDTDHPGCYYRMVDGVQEWENPPFELGVEYRTTKRWQGYPLYQMLVEFGAPPLSTSKEVRTNVPSNTWRIGFERRLARGDGDQACYGQEVPSIIKEYIYNSGATCVISVTTGDSELRGYHMFYLVTYAY